MLATVEWSRFIAHVVLATKGTPTWGCMASILVWYLHGVAKTDGRGGGHRASGVPT